MTVYACISTHHLLDHKPDNLLRTGHKFGISGVYKFGTPGIAVVWAEHRIQLENFMDTLKSNMPQKKFQLLLEREWSVTSTTIPNGWTEMPSAAALKQALLDAGAPLEDYYNIMGVDVVKEGTSETARSSKGKSGTKKGGKSGKGKK